MAYGMEEKDTIINHNRGRQRTRKQGKKSKRSQITKDPSRNQREGGKRKGRVIKGRIRMPACCNMPRILMKSCSTEEHRAK